MIGGRPRRVGSIVMLLYPAQKLRGDSRPTSPVRILASQIALAFPTPPGNSCINDPEHPSAGLLSQPVAMRNWKRPLSGRCPG
jgi:hypothetical protein